ncbi:peptidylprolyl isomerase [Candidatus Pelagibacter sp.]|nr:peptidylprolyl isomerase [Candidatus Pelagibacter sp.]
MIKILYIIFICMGLNTAFSLETKIIYNIQNEIITNIDIKNEFKYLLAFNNQLKNLDKEKIFKISKESIIKEKIKKIELSKYYKDFEVDDKYTNVLLKNIYKGLNFQSLQEFETHLEFYNLSINDIRKKLIIDALWNELIVKKYNSKIEIDEQELRNIITNDSKNEEIEYKLSEIVYEVTNKQDIENKYKEIKKSITEIGFENSASIYSISETGKIGGNIGWINERSLNLEIMKKISKLDLNEISKPIIITNGILILKIKDTKKIKSKINYDVELKKLINYERNKQLNQYSKIYFEKAKKNIDFNE